MRLRDSAVEKDNRQPLKTRSHAWPLPEKPRSIHSSRPKPFASTTSIVKLGVPSRRSPMSLRLIGSERLLVCPISMLAKSLARNTPGTWPCPEMMIAVIRGRAWPPNICSGGTDEAFLPLANAVELIPGQRDRQTKGEGAPVHGISGDGGRDPAFQHMLWWHRRGISGIGEGSSS